MNYLVKFGVLALTSHTIVVFFTNSNFSVVFEIEQLLCHILFSLQVTPSIE